MAVYFIQAGENGPVKIGYATDVAHRCRDLQTGHYEALRIIRVIETANSTAERWLHRHFDAERLRGEWFRFDVAMLTIEPLTKNPIIVTAAPTARKFIELEPIAIRAKEHKISLLAICRRAEIATSTLRRWRRGLNESRVSLQHRAERALDDLIAERKANA